MVDVFVTYLVGYLKTIKCFNHLEEIYTKIEVNESPYGPLIMDIDNLD